MSWRIEYTNHPWLKKKSRKILEKAVAEAIRDIERMLKIEGDDGFMLGDTGFAIESMWVEHLKKHHLAVEDFKHGGSWVASLVFERYPTMTVEEAKSILREIGFSEHSIYALSAYGTPNEQTVGEFLAQHMENLESPHREKLLKALDLVIVASLEKFLEQGIIKLSDRFLDALRKIDRLTQE